MKFYFNQLFKSNLKDGGYFVHLRLNRFDTKHGVDGWFCQTVRGGIGGSNIFVPIEDLLKCEFIEN